MGAAARTRRASATAPLPVRRVRPAPGRAPAPRAQAARPAASRGAAVLDRLLYGRGWIALVFVLLAGIVFFNVDLIQMNRDIAATAERAGEVRRENAKLRTTIARLGSSERIQRVAAEAGLVLPAPGEVRYLRSDPSADAGRAVAQVEEGAAAPVASEPVVVDPVIAEAPAVEPVVTEPAPAEHEQVDHAPVAATDPAAALVGQ